MLASCTIGCDCAGKGDKLKFNVHPCKSCSAIAGIG